jgi:uncharacterized protein (TIGR03437 family)
MSSKTFVLCSMSLLAVSPLFAQVQPKPFGSSPARIVGQPSLTTLNSSRNPNNVEGKELWRPSSVAVDTSESTPKLYVSDTLNNRVLGWASATGFAAGDPATIVIGQRDMQTTYAQGPGASGSTLSRGLYSPTGITVDTQGNLYVVDSGNNRILRYPKPFVSDENRKNPDLVIGQANYTSASANRGGLVTAEGINPVGSGDSHTTSQQLAWDPSGNLWFTDTGNHRVLRYPKSGDTVAPTADVVIGQTAMNLAAAATTITNFSGLRLPVGVTVDSSNRVYVADGINRVLVFASPAAAGATAVKALGVYYGTPPTTVNSVQFSSPMGLMMIGDRLGAADTGHDRIVVFDAYDAWVGGAAGTTSPAGKIVLGQGSLTINKPTATRTGLRAPFQGVMANGELYVADGGNNRVVVYANGFLTAPFGTASASRVIGQVDFGYSGANIVDGRGLYLTPGYFHTISGVSGSFIESGGVVVDTTSTPPRLYVADTYNNRVLGYKDARKVKPGDAADLVIGQANMLIADPNGPLNDDEQRDSSTMYGPAGLAVDADGNLWVADLGNGRLLRFPKPFAQAEGSTQRATVVLGQRNFTDKNTDVSQSNMTQPYGVAVMPEGHLLASDYIRHRVLLFRRPTGGDFANGANADAVFGQTSFDAATPSTSQDGLAFPHGIAVDGSGRLYVADTGNNRVVIYTQVGSGVQSVGLLVTNAAATTALKQPAAVAVDKYGYIWVSNTATGTVLRYPEYSALQLMAQPLPDFSITPGMPAVALAHDANANLVVGEFGNRVSFYFRSLWTTSAANYLPSAGSASSAAQNHACCAPGSIAALWPFSSMSSIFGQEGDAITTDFGSLPNPVPLPKALGDVELLLSSSEAGYASTAAPLYFVAPTQINFQIPKGAPTATNLNAELVKVSTGQVLAAGTLRISPTAPGLLTKPSFPIGTLVGAPTGVSPIQVAATNLADNSCNGSSGAASDACPGGVRPADRREHVSLWLTGQGFISGMPEDGDIAPSTLIWTPMLPKVFINSGYVADDHIQYSGLAPTLIGVWQINVKIPEATPPGAVRIAVVWGDVASSELTLPYTVIHVR